MKYLTFLTLFKKLLFIQLVISSVLFFSLAFGQNPTDNTFSIVPYCVTPNSPTILPLPIGPTQTGSLFDDYNGEFATNCHNSMRNLDGELQFFVVDDKIYDAEGYLLNSMIHVNTFVKGTSETVIVPDPYNCNRYYIFAVGRIDYTTLSPKLPYYTILDMELENNAFNPGRKGEIDPLITASGNTVIGIKDISPSHFTFGTSQGNCFIAASKERADKSRFVYISNGVRVYRYIIDQNGLSYDNYYGFFNPSGDATASRGNGEMELIEVQNPIGNEYYRIAVPYEAQSPNGAATSIFTADVDIDGNVIPSSVKYFNFEHVFGHIDGGLQRAFIHGLEFSSDGNILYVMHDINDFHPNNLEYVDLTDPNPTLIPITTIPNSEDFEASQLEVYGGQLYFVTNDRFGILTTPNQPATSNYVEQTFPSANFYPANYQGGNPSWQYWNKQYILPDQIDGEDYQHQFISTPECCILNQTYQLVDEDKFDNLTTWENGFNNNPFGVTTGQEVFIEDELIIPAGRTITIKNMTFKFSPKAKVVIERGTGALKGGRLILDGTTFTYDDNCEPDGFWFGVQVYGYETEAQSPISNSQQGVLQMQNGSKIERAYKGVTLGRFNQHINYPYVPSGPVNGFGGGVVTADNSSFVDNIQDVHFRPYTYQNINNRSVFRNCSFVTESELNTTFTFEHIWLNGIQGVLLLGNRFENEHASFYGVGQKGIGIVAVDARFSVLPLCLTPTQFPITPCTNLQPNTFQALRTGIRITSSNPLRTALIDKNDFIDNDYGVVISSADFATVTRNHFEVSKNVNTPTINAHAGVVVRFSRGYKVEENYFTDFNDPAIIGPAETRGVVVQNSGETYNEVYNNTFRDIAIGVQTEGINGELNPQLISANGTPGLQIKCNTFIKDMYIGDIYVASGRIARFQGYCATGILANLFTSPAGNLFDQSNLGGVNDIELALGVSPIRYYHHNTPTYIPLNYTSTVDPFSCSQQFDPTKHCLSKINDGPFVVSKNDLISKKDSLGQLKDDLFSLVDEGNTQNLLNLIATGTNGSIKDALLAASPFLSDEVLIAYLESNPPAGHINQVIQANSPVSEDIMNYLSGMGLPNGINNQINNAQTGISEMENLGAAISGVEHERNMVIDELIRGYLNDSLSVSPMDSIRLLLNEETIRTRREQICDAHLMDEHTQDAEMERQQIEADCGFDNYSRSIIALMETFDYPTICEALKTDSLLFEEVEDIAYDPTDRVNSGRAEAMLCVALDSVVEVIVAPYWSSANKSLMSNQIEDVKEQIATFFIYPNPSNGNRVTVVLNVDELSDKENAELVIYDIRGKIIQNYAFNEMDELELNITNYKQGMYFVTLKSTTEIIQTKKLIIVK